MTFTEKVIWRMLFDRRPIIGRTGDKLESKEYALKTASDVVSVPRTLWRGEDVSELAAMELPEHWVLKPNHRSKLVHFGRGTPDVAQLHDVTAGWLDEPLSRAGEWAYSQAAPVLLVEELLGMPGHPPRDFKFFVFQGRPHLVQVDSDRHVGHRRSLYTEDWLRLPIDTPFQQLLRTSPSPSRSAVCCSRLRAWANASTSSASISTASTARCTSASSRHTPGAVSSRTGRGTLTTSLGVIGLCRGHDGCWC